MGFNFGNAYATGVAGAAAGLSGGPAGALAGGVAGLITGGFSGSNGSSSAVDMNIKDLYNLEMYNTMKDIYFMNLQDSMNRGTMRYQTDLQRELNEQAFNYNNYFLDNAYQKSVNSMRSAGLNPLLLSGNSPSVGSASAGTASALGTQQGSHGIDPSSMLSASANSAQASVAKGQLGLNAANTVSEIAGKTAASSLALEQAKTEANKRDNLEADTLLKGLQSVRQNIENSNLDDKMKAEIYRDISTAESSMILARVEDYLKSSKAYNYVHSANAQETSAGAQKVIADATKGKLGAEQTALDIENKFNKEHPGVYGTAKVLHAIGPLVSLFGTGMIAKGLGMKGLAKPNVNKEVIMKAPPGFQYGN